MDLSCIISSGDLELYILGMLSSEDAQKIEQLAKLFPEIQEELNAIENALLHAANEQADAPAPAVKEQLFDRLKHLPPTTLPPRMTVADRDTETKDDVVPMYAAKRTNTMKAAAIIGLLVAAGALTYTYFNNNNQRAELTAMQQRVDSLQNSAAAQQQQIAELDRNMRFYQDTGYKMINLLPMPNRPKDLLVQIFWDKKSKAVYAANVSLPKAPEGKQYQLWAFVNGKPVSAGLLDEKQGSVEEMSVFKQAEAFAITLEAAGGVTSPTVSEMYVMGTV